MTQYKATMCTLIEISSTFHLFNENWGPYIFWEIFLTFVVKISSDSNACQHCRNFALFNSLLRSL